MIQIQVQIILLNVISLNQLRTPNQILTQNMMDMFIQTLQQVGLQNGLIILKVFLINQVQERNGYGQGVNRLLRKINQRRTGLSRNHQLYGHAGERMEQTVMVWNMYSLSKQQKVIQMMKQVRKIGIASGLYSQIQTLP